MTIYIGLLLCFFGTALAENIQDYETPNLYKPVGKCPAVDGEHPVYLPDSDDLTVFYQCSNGIPWKNKCPPNTIFDSKRSVCVRPKSQVQRELEKPIMYKPVEKCPEKDREYPIYIPDSEDKKIYYECKYGQPWMKKCPPGTIFVKESYRCE